MSDNHLTSLPTGDELEAEVNPKPEPYYPIAKVWKETLDNADEAEKHRPTADWCSVIIGKWPFLKAFSDMQQVHNHYFRILRDCRRVLDEALEAFPEALEVTSRDEDVEQNKDFYVRMLAEWQKALLVEQSEWDCDADDAAPWFVALGEVQSQLVGRDGLVSYLGAIDLPFNEDEQAELDKELREFRESLEVR